MKISPIALSILLSTCCLPAAQAFAVQARPFANNGRQHHSQQHSAIHNSNDNAKNRHTSPLALNAMDPSTAVAFANHASSTLLAFHNILHSSEVTTHATLLLHHQPHGATVPVPSVVSTTDKVATKGLQEVADWTTNVQTVVNTARLFQKCTRRLSDMVSSKTAAILTEKAVLDLGEDWSVDDDIAWGNHVGLALNVAVTAVAYRNVANRKLRRSSSLCERLSTLSTVANLLQ